MVNTDLILLLVAGAGAYYEFVVRGGQDLQNLFPPAAGGTGAGAAAPACQGKDATGAACPCPATSAVAFAYASKKKSSSHASSSKNKAKGSAAAATPPAPAAAAGGCDCSACNTAPSGAGAGGNTAAGAGTSAGGTWGQNPASKIPCDIPGQACSPVGSLGGTSNWCKCVAGGGAATAAAKTTKTAKGGVGTVESFAGNAIAGEGYGMNYLNSYRVSRYW